MLWGGTYVHASFKIEMAIVEGPICEGGAKEEGGPIHEVGEGSED